MAMDKLSNPAHFNKGSHEIPQQQQQLSDDQAQDAPLELGNRVTIFDKNDKPINGIVRWIGINRQIIPSGSIIVGVATVKFRILFI